jgi:hypothetical protein
MQRVVKHVVVFILLVLNVAYSQRLFPVQHLGKYGYVDLNGDTAIRFIYNEAGNFGCGLAPVRTNGFFGYIDERGEYLIPPAFDYAEPFYENRAFVQKDNVTFVIDKKGKKIFEFDKKYRPTVFSGGAMVVIYNQKQKRTYGLLDTNGKFLLKPEWEEIKKVNNKYFSVTGSKGSNLFDGKKFFTTFSKFNEYYTYGDDPEGVVSFEDAKVKNQYHYVVWNKNAEPITSVVSNDPELSPDYLGNGLFCVYDLYHDDEEDVDTVRALYIVDQKLDTIFSSKEWSAVSGFHNGVSFVGVPDGYKLVNTKFEYVSDSIFSELMLWDFTETRLGAFALVRNAPFNYGMVDTTAKMSVPYQYQDLEFVDKEKGYLKARIYSPIQARRMQRWKTINKMRDEWRATGATQGSDIDSTLDFQEDSMHKTEPKVEYLEGVIDCKNKIQVPFIYTDLSRTIYGPDILRFEDTLGEGLVRTDGREIYRIKTQGAKSGPLRKCNVSWMTSGFFFAGSDETEPRSMGWSSSINHARGNGLLPANANSFAKGISVYVDTTSKDTVEAQFLGYSVYVVNAGSDTAYFTAQDSRLHMYVQAQDDKKKWRDIEHLSSSWCGNSYHALKLGPSRHWKFAVPQYDGQTKTRLRIVLEDDGGTGMNRWLPKDQVKKHIYFSNEFGGYVNPAQFYRRPERSAPRDIMDPYSE